MVLLQLLALLVCEFCFLLDVLYGSLHTLQQGGGTLGAMHRVLLLALHVKLPAD